MSIRVSGPVLTTLIWLLAAAVSSGQEPRIVKAEAQPAAGKSRELLAPFERFEDTHTFTSGFQDAGRRSTEPLPGRRGRLTFVLSGAAGDTLEENHRFGDLGFRDRWLVNQIERRIDGIETVDVVDRIVSRTRGDTTSSSRERSLEIVGASAAAFAAEQFLDSVLVRNREQVLLEVHMVRRHVAEDSGRGAVTVAALDRTAIERQLDDWRTAGNIDVMAAPRLIVLGGQSATVTVCRQISYVRSFETHTVCGDTVLDPLVDVLNDGIFLSATPIVGPDGKSVYLAIDISISAVKLPIETSEVELPSDDLEFEIQLPEVSVVDWSSEDLELLEGEHGFLVSTLRSTDWTDDGDRREYEVECLIKLEILDPAAIEMSLSSPVAVVLGYDPDTRLAFARLADATAARLENGTALVVLRNGETVGTGRVTELLGDVLMIALDHGEVTAADDVYVAR